MTGLVMPPRASLVTLAEMRPSVVVVAGMHRSGTSLLAQVLGRLGVPLGSNLLVAPAFDNKYGYWEHAEIARTQDILLAELGRMWHEPRGVLPLPAGWLGSAPAVAAQKHLTGIVREELTACAAGAAEARWGFKDPRTIRLMPMWQRIFEACGVTPIYILAVRRPQSVAQSLKKRNGMTEAQARFLWAQHNLDFFRLARPTIAALVDYDQWFSRPARNMQQILRALRSPLALPVALDMCDAILDRGERHHDGDTTGGGDLADRIYRLLLDPMPDAFRAYRMKQIVRQLDDSAAMLTAWQDMIESCHPAAPPPAAHWAAQQAKAQKAKAAGSGPA